MTFLRKSGTLVVVWIKSLATAAWFPSALVGGAMEQILPWHISCQDPVSKSQTQQFLESPDQLLVLALSVADLCWLQPVHVQHSHVFCLLQAFQNVGHFQQILDHLWSICATLLFAPHSAMSLKGIFLNHLNSFHTGMFRLSAKIWFRFVTLLTESFWIWWPHSTHAHATLSATPTD